METGRMHEHEERTPEDSCRALGHLAARMLPDPPSSPAEGLAAFVGPRSGRGFSIHGTGTVVAALMGAAVVGFVAWGHMRREPTWSFQVTGGTVSADGAIASESEGQATAEFDDGSTVRLVGETNARIDLAKGGSGPTVLLGAGTADLSVVHRQGVKWRVTAGPFHVDVTGTKFRVDWDPSNAKFRIDMREGRVIVSGGSLAGNQSLESGQSLDLEATTAPPAATRSAPPDLPEPLPVVGAPDAKRDGSVRLEVSKPNPVDRSRIEIGDDGRLGGRASGYAWVAGGTGTTFVPCNAHGCFSEKHGQLCTRGEVAALTCTSPQVCDGDTNWGAMIGLGTNFDVGAAGSGVPTSVWVDYTGAPGRYRLTAHVTGDPESKFYCVEGYASGTEAPVGLFKSECWSGTGTALSSFASVDKFGLMLLPEHSAKPFDYCIRGVWMR
jgi:hypothetical protein